jgi:hypothetical protein
MEKFGTEIENIDYSITLLSSSSSSSSPLLLFYREISECVDHSLK